MGFKLSPMAILRNISLSCWLNTGKKHLGNKERTIKILNLKYIQDLGKTKLGTLPTSAKFFLSINARVEILKQPLFMSF